jgi:hypothetical protein
MQNLEKNFYDDNDEYNLVGRLLIQPVIESIVHTVAISNQGNEDSEGHSYFNPGPRGGNVHPFVHPRGWTLSTV